jgi:hypothetical protein
MTPNRKIDRNALPAPSATGVTNEFTPAADGVEEAIAGVWARVLGVGRVGRSDNFFSLGGHSLLAVQAHRELKARLGSDRIAITDIFRFPVLSALAAHLGNGGAGTRVGPVAASPNPFPTADTHDRVDAMERRRAMREARERAQG